MVLETVDIGFHPDALYFASPIAAFKCLYDRLGVSLTRVLLVFGETCRYELVGNY